MMQCVPTSAMALAAWRNLELGEEIRIGWGDRGRRCGLPFAWEDGSRLVDVQIVQNGEGRVGQAWVLAEEEAVSGLVELVSSGALYLVPSLAQAPMMVGTLATLPLANMSIKLLVNSSPSIWGLNQHLLLRTAD